MSEQKYIPTPKGGWTEDNIPCEFEYEVDCCGETTVYSYTYKPEDRVWLRSTGEVFCTGDVVFAMNQPCRLITKIIKPHRPLAWTSFGIQ